MKFNKIRFEKKGVETLLSPLEADVLRILWENDNVKARDVYNVLKKKRKVALTSVVVILDRLHKKKLVKRTTKPGRGGYHYIYTPSTTKVDFEHSIMEGVTDKLIDTFGSSAVNYFNERFSKKKGRK
jgi:predicted transcriptional regulator